MITKSLTISTTNITLKSEDEQYDIMQNFAKLLDSAKLPIQILFSCSKYNLKNKKTKIKNEDYDKFLKKIITKNNIFDREFKIILNNEDEEELDNYIEIVKRYIKLCGLRCLKIENIKAKDYIPQELNRNYAIFDSIYYQTFYIFNYPRYCHFGWLDDIYNFNINMDISMNIEPVSNYDAIKYLEHKIAVNAANSSINEDNDRLSDEYDEYIVSAMNMRDEIFKKEGRMYLLSFYITLKSKNKKDLLVNSQKIKFLLKSKGITVSSCIFRHDDGYRCTREINSDILNKKYNLTTKSLKYFFPFLSNHIIDKDGVFFGMNLLTPGPIFLNPFIYNSALMLVLGKVGGGKTYTIQLFVLRLAYMGVQIDIWDKTNFEYNSILKLTNLSNIKVHCYETIEEYECMIENYIKEMNDNLYNLKQRILIIDEGYQFLKSSKICDGINTISLSGRKYFQGLCFITQMIEHIQNENILSLLRQSSIKVLMQMELNAAKVVQKELYLTDNEVRFLSSAYQEGILFAGSNRTQFKALASEKEDKVITTDPNKRILNEVIV